MTAPKPISTAPMDGSKITVVWTDRNGQENQSIAQYRSLARMKATGGDWDESDAGWWAFIDSDTQRRIEPHGWKSFTGGDEED